MAVQPTGTEDSIYTVMIIISTVFVVVATVYLAIQYHQYYGLDSLLTGVGQL